MLFLIKLSTNVFYVIFLIINKKTQDKIPVFLNELYLSV